MITTTYRPSPVLGAFSGAISTAITGQARLPHYGPAAVMIGTLVLLAVMVTLAIAIARSRRK
ncbi:hypothetical protein Misp02_59760 [Microtetraspora sp. NBRC 16547]|nr:hypothetical protein Misp02_59760 [Microtetraspora sp. NBRC 16547]